MEISISQESALWQLLCSWAWPDGTPARKDAFSPSSKNMQPWPLQTQGKKAKPFSGCNFSAQACKAATSSSKGGRTPHHTSCNLIRRIRIPTQMQESLHSTGWTLVSSPGIVPWVHVWGTQAQANPKELLASKSSAF